MCGRRGSRERLLIADERRVLLLHLRAAQLEAVRSGCRERDIVVGPPLYAGGMRRTLAQPYVDEDECMHWPVLLLYPQHSTSDFLEEVAESASIGDILAAVLPRGGRRPDWDSAGEYSEDNVDVFYKTNPCKPLPVEEWWTRAADERGAETTWQTSRLVRVPPIAPLLFPISRPGYVVADIPVFYVVARSSDCWARMKAEAGGDFVELRVPKSALPS